jgi:HlyD family secretion protein
MAKKSSKKTIIIIVILVSLFAGFGILARTLGWLDTETGTLIETASAERRTITQLVSSSGIIRPEVEVILTPDVSGEIIELRVKEGDFVSQGDLLLRIRPDLYEARIDEIQASLLNARAREQQAMAGLLRARAFFQQQEQLYQRQMIPNIEFVTAKTQYEAEQANHNAATFSVQSVEAQLRRAQEELRQTVIRAPMTGTISKLNVERGERVVGSVQMTGTEIMRIARMEQMEVEVRVNENDIMKVAVSDTARVMVDAYPGRTIQGIVTEIANSAIRRGEGTTEQVSEYLVKIRILTPHNLTHSPAIMQVSAGEELPEISEAPFLKPGMSASVDIETRTVVNVVSVPIQAVTVRDFSLLKTDSSAEATTQKASSDADTASATGDTTRAPQETGVSRQDMRRVVFVVEDGVAKMVEVETGINDDRFIHILRGIDQGNQIVTGSFRVLSRQLSDGDQVRVN